MTVFAIAAALALILAGVAPNPWATLGFAGAGWGGLRLARAPGLRLLFGETPKAPVGGPGAVMARETGLAMWVLAAIHGLAVSEGLAEVGYLPRASVLFGLLLVTAFLEGDVDRRASPPARWMVIAVAVLTHLAFLRAVVDYLHDAMISDLLATVPIHLGLLLPALLVAALFAASLALFVAAWSWYLPLLPFNGLALRRLRHEAVADPGFRRFFERRHRWHRIVCWPPLVALRSAAVALWEALFGNRDWYLPRPIVPDRFEIFLGDRLREAEENTRQVETQRRQQWLRQGSPMSDLRQALERQTVAFVAYGDLLFCPHRPCPRGCTAENRRRLLRRSVELWQQLRRLTAMGGGVADRQASRTLVKRMRSYQLSLEGSEDAWSRRLVELCQGTLRALRFDDRERLAFREQVLAGLGGDPDGGELAVGLLLNELWIAGDWAGHCEAFRRAQLAGYEPVAADCLRQGEAYCRQALELGPGLLQLWTLEQAVSQFHQAAAGEHLAVAKELILEVRGDAA